jgi:hypothetical protein
MSHFPPERRAALVMSAMGPKETCPAQDGMSASLLKADIGAGMRDVRYVPILLQKSVAPDGCPSAIGLRVPGFDLPALTRSTQLSLYAMH